MIEIGGDILTQLAEGQIHHAKLVFNDRGFIAFPTPTQHNTMKAEGISYENNYRGNAMAAMLKPDAIEVRYHEAFSDARVELILSQLLAETSLGGMRNATVTYQGRRLCVDDAS